MPRSAFKTEQATAGGGMIPSVTDAAAAWFGGRLATGLVEVTDDPASLDGQGWWAVAHSFEGVFRAARFESVVVAPHPPGRWGGVPRASWSTSLDEREYVKAVSSVRERIAAGDVYQANICRVMSAPLAPGCAIPGLSALLTAGNPAPYGGFVHVPELGLDVATASPELFLRRRADVVESGPIKGTGRTPDDLQPKDVAENIMIVDLVRNDLSRVCEPGSVTVPHLLGLEEHPGLVHLVSTVRGDLVAGTSWADLLAATFPPGSVTGAPKSSALRIIGELETAPRDVYCGAVGWVDADAGQAELAVGIRTFWSDGDTLRFGTGAGITWGSDPYGEWAETELKADRLLSIAAQEAGT